MKNRYIVLSLLVFAIFSSCSNDEKTPAGHSRAEGAVVWESLNKLDLVIEEAVGQLKDADLAMTQNIGAAIKKSANEVINSPIPNNAKNPQELQLVLDDLKSLVDALDENAENLDQTKQLLEAVHPIVERLMETSGVPHVHEHNHEHDHEHGHGHH